MARKLLIVACCFLVICQEARGFLIPTQRTTAAKGRSDINDEIVANERKISNLTQKLSDDYRKYSYLITTYL
ncbi:unnamed protein product, partial [Iphiclides podalirius]